MFFYVWHMGISLVWPHCHQYWKKTSKFGKKLVNFTTQLDDPLWCINHKLIFFYSEQVIWIQTSSTLDFHHNPPVSLLKVTQGARSSIRPPLAKSQTYLDISVEKYSQMFSWYVQVWSTWIVQLYPVKVIVTFPRYVKIEVIPLSPVSLTILGPHLILFSFKIWITPACPSFQSMLLFSLSMYHSWSLLQFTASECDLPK